MTFEERIARQVALLPSALKALLDTELAAGNAIRDTEVGQGEREGQVILVLEKAFTHPSPKEPPPLGLVYRETLAADRRFTEFLTTDERFSLVTVRFKPMVFPPLLPERPIPTPPPSEPAAETAEAVVPEAAALPVSPAPPKTVTVPANPADRFIDSMTLTFDHWHDGLGYDLNALRAVPPSERLALETRLIAHQPRDWRDIEALAVLGSPHARQVIEDARTDPSSLVCREAARYAAQPADSPAREALLLQSLQNDSLFGGLSAALDEAAEFHPPPVIEALLQGTLHRDGETAVHFAALLYFLHDKSKEPFDWNYRPFFLRFHTTDVRNVSAVIRQVAMF